MFCLSNVFAEYETVGHDSSSQRKLPGRFSYVGQSTSLIQSNYGINYCSFFSHNEMAEISEEMRLMGLLVKSIFEAIA